MKAWRPIRDLSIRRKQMLILMLTAAAGLLLACGAFTLLEVVRFRSQLAERVTTLADVLGNNCTAAIEFGGPNDAEGTLASIRAEPNIVAAAVFDGEGRIFAVYRSQPAGAAFISPRLQRDGAEFEGGLLHVYRPIQQKGERVGTIYLASELAELPRRLALYAGVGVLVFLGSLAAAFGLSSRLQRLVSEPLLQLAGVARAVARDRNYGLRAAKAGQDELGQLVDRFNEMLAEIQQREAALQAARDELEQRVQQRTAELAHSVSLLNATLESTADGILVVDRNGRVTSFNNKFVEMWKIPREIVAAKNDDQLLGFVVAQLSDSEAFLAKVQELYAQSGAESFDTLEFKDGRRFERYSQPQRLGDECAGRVWCFRDVSERKRAEEALLESQALYHSLVEHLSAGIFRKDKSGRYVFVNSWFCRLKRMRAEELLGKTPQELAAYELAQQRLDASSATFETRLAAQGEDHHEQILRTGEEIQVEEEYPATEGTKVFLRVVKSPVFGSDGRIAGSQGMMFDITAIREAEARLAEAHRELVSASRRAGMAEIATNVLHNVGNVLNSVNTSAGVISERVRGSKVSGVSRLAELLRSHAADLAGFLNQQGRAEHVINYLESLAAQLVAEHARIHSETDELHRNVEHIKEIVAMQQSYARTLGVIEFQQAAELVEDAVRMQAATLARQRVHIERQFDVLPPIAMDRHKVLQILINLVRNAQQALMSARVATPTLTLRIRRVGEDRVQIVVTDNGVGIEPENLIRIFSHGFTTRAGGHGFGLHSGWLAAREMDGALSVQSDGPGCGATFTLELPFRTRPASA